NVYLIARSMWLCAESMTYTLSTRFMHGDFDIFSFKSFYARWFGIYALNSFYARWFGICALNSFYARWFGHIRVQIILCALSSKYARSTRFIHFHTNVIHTQRNYINFKIVMSIIIIYYCFLTYYYIMVKVIISKWQKMGRYSCEER